MPAYLSYLFYCSLLLLLLSLFFPSKPPTPPSRSQVTNTELPTTTLRDFINIFQYPGTYRFLSKTRKQKKTKFFSFCAKMYRFHSYSSSICVS